MQNKHKNSLYKILFLVIMLGFIISLVGCDWFSNGLFNIFDPKAQIITEYNPEESGEPAEGCCNAGVSCINGVEFYITGFAYNYYGVDYIDGNIGISELSRVMEASFYVAPSTSPGTPGPKTIIENIPLFFQDVLDYLYLHPFITEITCDLSLVGVDGSGHSLSFQIASELPIFEPGIDLYPPTAVITTTPAAENGNLTDVAPFSIVFDASESYDFVIDLEGNIINIGSGIVSINWDFGDESTETDITVEHTYDNPGIYIVTLTVTDLYGNQGYATIVITVTEVVVPGVDNITVNANPQSNAPGGTSIISAIVTNTEGDAVDDGTTVYFYTNSGELDEDSAVTTNGIAKVNLTLDVSMQDGDIAIVTAFIGAVNGFVEVTCTVAVEVGAKIDTTPSPATGFIPFTVGFDASRSTVASPPIVSYEWEFTGGDPSTTTTATGVTAVHTFLGNGTYLVKLTVTDSAQPTANVYVAFVTVIANP